MKIQKLSKKLSSEKKAISYLVKHGFIKSEKKCWRCKRPMAFNIDLKLFRCYKKNCGVQKSIFQHSFFATCRLGIHNLLWIAYLFLYNTPTSSIVKMTGISSKTICEWVFFIRQMLADMIDFCDVKIGGPGVIVEVDETKLGKRKYHKGHHVEGVWVIAGVERTPEKKMFLVSVDNRDMDTLENIFRTFILHGSIIYTDGWKPYVSVCEKLHFEHKIVNHKYHFKDPITEVHTNNIEGCNNGLKTFIRPRNRCKKNIDEWLFYFVWMRLNKKKRWEGFLKAIKEVVY